MKKLFISLAVGMVAGIVDIIPMILQRLDWYANISAFVQWLVLGVIINHVEIGLKGWLKGLVIGEAAALPIMILVAKEDSASVLPIIVSSAILGSFVGFAGKRFAK